VRAAIAGVAVGAVIAGMIACGGPGTRDVSLPPSYDKHQEILVLWTQIREFRSKVQLKLDPSAQALIAAKPTSVEEQRHVCPDHHDVPPACNEVCNLSDDICDNAEQICKIADELGKDDSFAQDKCNDAKASCREGKQRCCGCTP
jgi:hypothetical protein